MLGCLFKQYIGSDSYYSLYLDITFGNMLLKPTYNTLVFPAYF